MIHETINLKEIYPQLNGGNNVILKSYCPDNFIEWSIGRKRKTVLILPGGGYQFVSEREGEPIALQYLHEDINAFVLTYTVKLKPSLHPLNPIDEVFAAILYIREHAEHFNVDPNHIAVMGFSAGGHLAASTALFDQDEEYARLLNCDVSKLKINAVMLGYPVITLNEYTHEITSLIRTNNDPILKDKLSVQDHVTSDYPPTFIWTTCKDTCVDPLNSIFLADTLLRKGVTVEFHMYPEGDHGLATADEVTCNANDYSYMRTTHSWIKQSIDFIKRIL